MAGKLNLKILQGSTFQHVMTWKDGRARPVNLTGYTAFLQMRVAPEATILLELSTANGRITLGGTLGTITLSLTDEETRAITFSSASYDLLMEDAQGRRKRLVEGKVTVSPHITQ